MSKFFTFSQNNSGGSFIDNGSLGDYVVIEADNADDANERAMALGIYFNGVDEGIDCDCCGNRWYEVSGEGDDVPSKYGEPFTKEHKSYSGVKSYIHYLDGKVEVVG